MAEPQALPKVTPYLLRRADSMCARRLAKEYEGGDRSHDPVHRSRMRDAFLAAARDAHAELRIPTRADFDDVGADLEPEERAVLAQAAHWYLQVFGDRAARWDDLGLDSATVSPRRRVRIGGWIDLPVVTGDPHGFELRQLEFWGGRVPFDDPLELEAVRVAVLRLARWAGDAPLRVVWADLVHGLVRERVVETPDREALVEWFDDRCAIVRTRAAQPEATMGVDCGTCNFVAACPVHPTGAHYGRRRDVLPGILTITPTGLDTWRRCAREWRDAYLYGIPSSDTDAGAVHGQQMHDVLRVVHERGSCRDDAHVDDVLVANGFDTNDRMRGELARHRTRCPDPADALGHEVTRARFSRHPSTPFMATARFDALWVHDGVLDARDYKTGQVWSDRVADDKQARLQAWVLAPLADARGLTLRITFEHLAAEVLDDPEPFEPDADDLRAIEEELRLEVAAIRETTEFAGAADTEVCRRCRYRSICPDSTVPGVPVWPTVEPEDALDPA